jgi:hypothetical protein
VEDVARKMHGLLVCAAQEKADSFSALVSASVLVVDVDQVPSAWGELAHWVLRLEGSCKKKKQNFL